MKPTFSHDARFADARTVYSVTRSWPFSKRIIPGFLVIADGLTIFVTGIIGAILYLGSHHPQVLMHSLLSVFGALLNTSLLGAGREHLPSATHVK